MEYTTYLIYRCFCAFVSALPIAAGFHLGKGLGLVAYYLAWPYRRLVTDNMQIAFGGELSPGEIRNLARKHFLTLGANIFSSFKIASMSSEEVEKYVNIENLDALRNALNQKRGVVMVISHIGNWELFAQLVVFIKGVSGATIYQALGNRYIDAHMKASRSRFGVIPIDRKEGFNAPIKLLREGGLLGVLVDQHAGDAGIWAPLFGRLASTSPLAAILSSRTGAILLPTAIYTEGVAKWRAVISDPIQNVSELQPDQITAVINQALEAQIRVSPQDWFWVHNRWKTPSPKFLLASYKRGIAYPPGVFQEEHALIDRCTEGQAFDGGQGNPLQRLKPFRIMIRSSNWLGDAVMSAPAVQAIKSGRPDVHITILTKAKLADFWKNVPGVDAIIAIEAGDSVFGVARKLRNNTATWPSGSSQETAGPFDVAVLLPNSVRVALEAWLAGIPRRVGYRTKWRAKLLNQIVPEPGNKKQPGPIPPRHQVHHYLDLAKYVGANVSTQGDPGTQFPPRQVPANPASTTANPVRIIGLCPGADYGPAKRWLPERFAEVAKQVAGSTDCKWVLLGMKADAPIGKQIAEGLGDRCTNLIGQTSLAELIERLRQCSVLLTNDTGTMHLAAFLGIPTVSIFGSTEPLLTGPLGSNHRVLRHHVECSPCFLRTCPIDFRCMKEVTVEEVTEAVEEKLKK